jgi:hypothetical protein
MSAKLPTPTAPAARQAQAPTENSVQRRAAGVGKASRSPAIAVGNGSAAGPTTSLYFAAGPGDEAHGLFGSITAG